MADTPAPTQFDDYSTSYNDAVNASVSFSGLKVDFFTKVKAQYILALIASHFGDISDVRALDIGCGVGNFHPYLLGKVGSIAGVDVSAGCIQTAKDQNAGVAYKVYDGHVLPYATASMDVAYTVCVMHHVPPAQWRDFAAEMRRVVRPGGLGLVFEHNPFNPLTRRAVSSCPFDADAVLLTARSVSNLLTGAGFQRADRRYILSVPPLNPALMRVDRSLSRLPFGGQFYVAAS
jgi:SAM-dependent methyltransferase